MAAIRKDWETLDSLGSFRTPSGVEAICWTHRHEGWAIYDPVSRKFFGEPNKTCAIALARRLDNAARLASSSGW